MTSGMEKEATAPKYALTKHHGGCQQLLIREPGVSIACLGILNIGTCLASNRSRHVFQH